MDVHPTKNVSIGIDPYPYDSVYTICILDSVATYSINPERNPSEVYCSGGCVRCPGWPGQPLAVTN